jgi:para-nitrobenzyl esterase
MTLLLAFAPWLEQLDEASTRERERMIVGERADSIFDAYGRARPKESWRDLILAIATDQAMRMPSLIAADRKAAQHAAPVFVYLFTWETSVLGGRLKSPHALEIPFVFDNVEMPGLSGDVPTRFALAEKMSNAWLAFARTGNPNHELIRNWPQYSSVTRPTMILDNGSDTPSRSACSVR